MKIREVNWYIDTVNGVITEGFIDNVKTFGEKMYSRMRRKQPSWTYESDLRDYFFEKMNIPSLNYKFYELKNGQGTFSHVETLKEVHASFPKLTNGTVMFWECHNLKEFEAELPELVRGQSMFSQCYNLKEFNSELPKLEDGRHMFQECKSLVNFNADLPNLIKGESMFEDCKNLTEINFSSLDKLIEGDHMFERCEKLESFDCDMPNLKDGYCMFLHCTNLKHFNGDLSGLEKATSMFEGCALDTESIKNIAETIKEFPQKPASKGWSDLEHGIYIGVDVLDTEKKKYIEIIQKKGWDVFICHKRKHIAYYKRA